MQLMGAEPGIGHHSSEVTAGRIEEAWSASRCGRETRRGGSVTRVDHNGAKHSPPGHKFQKSRCPHASGPRPSEIRISEIKSYPNDVFSIPTLMIFNVDSNCVHPRF